MRIINIVGATLAGVSLAVWSVGADAANPRIALVIGESAYADATLPTTANDAGLVAQVLQAAGYEVVGARDLDQKSVRESLRDFLDKANAAGPDMQAFVYISGRALQYAGDNYLAPVDARIARDSDVPIEAVKISDFTHALAAAPGLARVVVIDGARPNPYAQQGQPLAGGLALVDPEPGSVIAFNAAPGAIGVEDAGDYGVYAKSLAGLMRQGGVDINDVLAQVRVDVNQKTQGAQMPWSVGKLDAPYFLFERAPDAPPVAARARPKKPLKQLSSAEAYTAVVASDRLEDYEEFMRDHARSEQARRIEAILAARREALFWRRTLQQNSPRAYWTYLKRYPKGPHAYDADRRLDTISARREPPRDFEVIEYEDLPPPPPREREYADRPVYYFGGDDFGPPPPPPPRDYVYYDEDDDRDWRDLPPPPRPTVAGLLPALAIAIPLGIAARAYYNRPDRDGRAPANAAPPPPRPLGPPPLPKGVRVIERPEAATPRPAAPVAGAAGEVKFAAPPPAPRAGGRPPAPLATPAAVTSPTPVDGKTPAPGATTEATPRPTRSPLPGATATPTPGASGEATPRPTRSPLPTPGATATPTPGPSGEATPRPTRSPLPTPGATATPTPGPSGEVTPRPTRSPLPTPGATATPTPGASGEATPRPTRSPRPTPGATATPTPGPSEEATPRPTRSPLPTPSETTRPEGKVRAKPTPEPIRSSAPEPVETKPALKAPEPRPEATKAPRPAAEPLKPKALEEPKAVETPRPVRTAEPLKREPRAEPAKPRTEERVREAPRPVEAEPRRQEAPRPAEAAPRRQEAPRPVEAAPRRQEAPRPAEAETRRPEAPRPAEARRPEPGGGGGARAGEGACGHPGQPRC